MPTDYQPQLFFIDAHLPALSLKRPRTNSYLPLLYPFRFHRVYLAFTGSSLSILGASLPLFSLFKPHGHRPDPRLRSNDGPPTQPLSLPEQPLGPFFFKVPPIHSSLTCQ